MTGSVFVMGTDGGLTRLEQSGYLTEDDLQELLADHPELLGGDAGDRPLRLLLIRREAGLADRESGSDRWSMDHIFFDQEAVPTIVEVKRSSDTRIRREVVGQMLDYAANAVVYLPPDRLRSWFEERCAADGKDPGAEMAAAFGDGIEPDDFWARAATNLQAGKIRMLFVADHIPAELRRIVEFLNGQMTPADVLAIEVVQYVGEGIRTLVPKTYGQTERARTTKSVGGSRLTREWDVQSFRDQLASRGNTDELVTFDAIVAWAKGHQLTFTFGKGGVTGSLYFMRELPQGGSSYTFSVWTNAFIGLDFGALKKSTAFEDPEARLEIVRRLNGIPGVNVSPGKIDVWPSIPLATIGRTGPSAFLAVYDWVLEQLP